MRVEVIDRGYLVAPSVESNPSDYTLDGCDRALKIDSFKWMVLKTKEGLDKPFRRYRCVSPEPLIHGGERIAANTEINPPVAYVPAWIGYRAGRGIAGVPFDYLGARLASLMAYLALTYGALRVLPFGRVFLAIVALLPGNLFVAAAVSADPMTVGVGFLFVSLVVRAVVDAREPKPMPTRSLCILGAVGVALALCKPSSLPLVILPLAIPTGAFGSLRRRVRATAAVVVPAVALGAAWVILISSKIKISMVPHSNSIVAAEFIRHHPKVFVSAVIHGAFDLQVLRDAGLQIVSGTNTQPLSTDVMIAIFGLCAAVAVARLVDPPGRRTAGLLTGERLEITSRWLSLGIASATIWIGLWVIAYGVALSSNAVAAGKIVGYQGRYLTPYIPVTLVGATGYRAVGKRQELLSFAKVLCLIVLLAINVWWTVQLFTVYY